MNKIAAKAIVRAANVRTASHFRIDKSCAFDSCADGIAAHFGYPVIVKPLSEGGSIGLTLATNRETLEAAVMGQEADLMAESTSPRGP